jgi:hypothetical protein
MKCCDRQTLRMAQGFNERIYERYRNRDTFKVYTELRSSFSILWLQSNKDLAHR